MQIARLRSYGNKGSRSVQFIEVMVSLHREDALMGLSALHNDTVLLVSVSSKRDG